jgi:hypothetical protein
VGASDLVIDGSIKLKAGWKSTASPRPACALPMAASFPQT